MSTGIVSKTGLTGATINGTVYEGTAYDKITTAADAENLVAVAGGTYSDGQITMNGDTIIGGTAAPVVISGNVNTSTVTTCYGGGAVLVNGSENTISGVTFSENAYNGNTTGGHYGGGAVCVQGGSLTIKDSAFFNNTSTNYGGALLITGLGEYIAIEDCYFSGNQGRAGAAILYYRGAGSISGSTFANHTGSATVYNSVNVTIDDCVFEKNSALSLMVNDATTTVTNTTFRNNTTGSIQATGGDGATLILDGVTFTNNTCSGANAAIYINRKLIIEKNGIVLDGNVGTQGAISIRMDSKECLIKGTITLMQSSDTIYIDSRTYQDGQATFKVDGASFIGDDTFAAKVVDARFATSWYRADSKAIEFADGYKDYTYLNDLFVLADDAVIAESHPGIVDADALAGEAGAAKINGEVYFGKYYNSLLDAAKAESTVIYNGALYTVFDKDAAFVGAGATPADETAKIIDGTVYVGAQYDSVKNAAAAEKFILVQGGTYKSGGQIVPLAGTTISGSNGATISENTIEYDTNKSGGAAIYNSNGELTVSGVTFAYTTASGNTFAGLGSAISNDKALTIDNCSFVGNTTTGGGAIVNTGTLTITNTKFVGNESRVGGALMFRGDHTDTYSAYIENCDFINNTAT
ncbi:MAG: right-handed parallel beta-helix repeat-containing protein, partial [Lentisphaeria bacterium]|nr:right-handed parallel beta-helix repeat-containing protein [Lentisphaeria bacterium]